MLLVAMWALRPTRDSNRPTTDPPKGEAPPPTEFDESEEARARQGEVVSRYTRCPKGGHGRALVWLPLPTSAVMDVLSEYELYAERIPNVTRATIYAQVGTATHVAIEVRLFVVNIITYLVHVRDENRIRWHVDPVRPSLYFATNSGSWTCRASGEGTLLQYDVRITLQISLPEFAIEHICARGVREAMEWVQAYATNATVVTRTSTPHDAVEAPCWPTWLTACLPKKNL